jgi:hypothetical protein
MVPIFNFVHRDNFSSKQIKCHHPKFFQSLIETWFEYTLVVNFSLDILHGSSLCCKKAKSHHNDMTSQYDVSMSLFVIVTTLQPLVHWFENQCYDVLLLFNL